MSLPYLCKIFVINCIPFPAWQILAEQTVVVILIIVTQLDESSLCRETMIQVWVVPFSPIHFIIIHPLYNNETINIKGPSMYCEVYNHNSSFKMALFKARCGVFSPAHREYLTKYPITMHLYSHFIFQTYQYENMYTGQNSHELYNDHVDYLISHRVWKWINLLLFHPFLPFCFCSLAGCSSCLPGPLSRFCDNYFFLTHFPCHVFRDKRQADSSSSSCLPMQVLISQTNTERYHKIMNIV